MKKIIILALAVISMLVLVGCGPKEVTVVIEDEGEEVTITGEGSVGDWCQAGSNWEMTAAGEDDAQASWIIDKLETSGEYEGLCHVVYTVTEDDKEMRMDYWFDESGENGYFEMDINGQKIKQEWHG